MAREPVAVDFLGLGNSLVENDSQGEADRMPLVKPISSIPEKPVVEMSRAVTLSERERAIGRENSISILRQAISSSQAERARSPAGGRGEEMQGGIVAKSSVKTGLEKPLEELTDADIMQLTREDCRRYLQERGTQKLSWNNQQAIQQVLSHRHHPDSRDKDEATVKSESTDAPHRISSPSLSEWEHTKKSSPSYIQALSKDGVPGRFHDVMEAHMKTPLLANGFLSPKIVPTTASLMSNFREEAQRGTQPSECAHAGSHPSLTTPVTQQHQPIVSYGPGLGTQLYGVVKTTPSPDKGVTTTAQHPPQMQGSTLSSRPGHTAGMGLQLCTTQLTIFYAGMVNVYDDIPLEKAHAIMLLADNAHSSSANQKNSHADAVPSVPMLAPQPSSAALAHPTTQAVTTSAAVPPPALLAEIISSSLRQPTVRNVHIELPQARKASLARFLEKRKDRVQSKGPYPQKTEGSTTPPREESQNPSSNKPQSRSPSPASAQGIQKQLPLSPHPMHQQHTSTGSKPNSPMQP